MSRLVVLVACMVTCQPASGRALGTAASRIAERRQADRPQDAASSDATTRFGRVVVTASLESLRIPAVLVTLHDVDRNVQVAATATDGTGQASIPDVPPGRYVVRAKRDGFTDLDTPVFVVEAGGTKAVLLQMHLTLIRETVAVIAPANSPTESLQPVAVSDVLNGAKMDVQPLAGDDFQSLLTQLPSVIRGPDGRLRLKGGGPTTGALQVSSASLNDPSTGDFDFDLPSGAVGSIEVLSNPFAAEYGRFSTSVTQVSIKRGMDEWTVKSGNLLPGFGKGFGFVSRFEPTLSLSGPVRRGRLFLGQYMQYRYVRTAVKSLPGDPQLGVDSFDSLTRLDAELSPRHALSGGVVYFPRTIQNATLSTFRPPETTPKFRQSGAGAGLTDWLIVSERAVLESTFAARRFLVEQRARGELPMVFAPSGQSGSFFSAQDRHVRSVQMVEALTVSHEGRSGEHVVKLGLDLQHSRFEGDSYSQAVETRRLDGSLAERLAFPSGPTHPAVTGTEFAVFAQDRWRVSDRVMVEAGIRSDRDDVRAARQPVAAFRDRREHPLGGSRDPPRRCGDVCGTHAPDGGGVHQLLAPDRDTVHGRWPAPDRTGDVRPRDRWPAQDAGELRPDRRVGRAVWPPLLLQGRLPPSHRLARAHRGAGSGPRRPRPLVHR